MSRVKKFNYELHNRVIEEIKESITGLNHKILQNVAIGLICVAVPFVTTHLNNHPGSHVSQWNPTLTCIIYIVWGMCAGISFYEIVEIVYKRKSRIHELNLRKRAICRERLLETTDVFKKAREVIIEAEKKNLGISKIYIPRKFTGDIVDCVIGDRSNPLWYECPSEDYNSREEFVVAQLNDSGVRLYSLEVVMTDDDTIYVS